MNLHGRRICLVSDHASPLATLGGVDAGGQNVYVAEVARGLARLGARVDVLTRRDGPDQPSAIPFGRGVTVFPITAGPVAPLAKERLLPHMDAFADAAVALGRDRRWDLVHANFFLSGLVAERLREELGIPVVVTFHALGRVRRREQGSADGFPDERFAIEERLARGAARVIAECPQDHADLIALYGATADRLRTVPCGVDTAAFRPGDRLEARRALGLPLDRPIVLQLGRLVPRKGTDDVIRALAPLADAGPPADDALLVVVGGAEREADPLRDPDIARLLDTARAAGVEDRVRVMGRRDRTELPAWYRAADVFVSTPWYEPFGITPLEAMACGTPVIGSAVGGVAWTVRDGETGLLVPPRDPAAIAAALTRLLADAPLRAAMAAAGPRHVRARFTWERVARQLAAVYAELLPVRRGAHLRRAAGPAGAALEAVRSALPGRARPGPRPIPGPSTATRPHPLPRTSR